MSIMDHDPQLLPPLLWVSQLSHQFSDGFDGSAIILGVIRLSLWSELPQGGPWRTIYQKIMRLAPKMVWHTHTTNSVKSPLLRETPVLCQKLLFSLSRISIFWDMTDMKAKTREFLVSNDGKFSIFAGNFLTIVPSMIDFLAQNMETREFSWKLWWPWWPWQWIPMMNWPILRWIPPTSRPCSRPPGPVSLGHPPPLPGWQGRLCWASDISDVVELLVVESPEILGFDQIEPWKILFFASWTGFF